ncbi:MAG: acetolactate synthase small subunit [Phaeodactylibacter sp.]|nr:acetolactate synthase small subunit [Phaeodactylibacter sp.]
MATEYTITVFSENNTGLLQRIVTVFTRRHINIESMTVSQSSMKGIHRFTIVVIMDQEKIENLVAQIEKQVDVLKAFYYTEDEIVHQEIALYKVPTEAFVNGREMEMLVRSHNARILEIEREYIVIEKTGHQYETDALLEELRRHGVYEFVRSGRVAVVKPMERLSKYLDSIEAKELENN